MKTVSQIFPNADLIYKLDKMNWQKNKISQNDKRLFKLVASNPDKLFTIEELSEKLKLSEDEIMSCGSRLDEKGFLELDFWQAVVINGIEYNEYEVIGKVGIRFPEAD